MIRDSKILLLDEISAALDSVSEAALHSALQNVLQVRQIRIKARARRIGEEEAPCDTERMSPFDPFV